jgi:hypothetical protein
VTSHSLWRNRYPVWHWVGLTPSMPNVRGGIPRSGRGWPCIWGISPAGYPSRPGSRIPCSARPEAAGRSRMDTFRSGRGWPCIWGISPAGYPSRPGSRIPCSARPQDPSSPCRRPLSLSRPRSSPAPRAPAFSLVSAPLSSSCLPGPPGIRKELSNTARIR